MSKELDKRITQARFTMNAFRRRLYWLEQLEKLPTLDPDLGLKVTSEFRIVDYPYVDALFDRPNERVVYVVIPDDFEETHVGLETPRWVAYEYETRRQWVLGGGFGPSPEEAIAGYLQEPGRWK